MLAAAAAGSAGGEDGMFGIVEMDSAGETTSQTCEQNSDSCFPTEEVQLSLAQI